MLGLPGGLTGGSLSGSTGLQEGDTGDCGTPALRGDSGGCVAGAGRAEGGAGEVVSGKQQQQQHYHSTNSGGGGGSNCGAAAPVELHCKGTRPLQAAICAPEHAL